MNEPKPKWNVRNSQKRQLDSLTQEAEAEEGEAEEAEAEAEEGEAEEAEAEAAEAEAAEAEAEGAWEGYEYEAPLKTECQWLSWIISLIIYN